MRRTIGILSDEPPLPSGVSDPLGDRVVLTRDHVVYMDHSATTPLDPRVFERMTPYLCELFGNPSGAYSLGRRCRGALEAARSSVASALHCDAAEIVFTSGGSESDTLAGRGVAHARRRAGHGAHLITSPLEHEAVLATVHVLEAEGFEISVLPVDEHGRVSPEDVLRELRPDTVLISVMLANNEVGTLEPLTEIASAVRRAGSQASIHTDAVQAAAYADLCVDALGVDLLSISAHKFCGPTGAGVLYVRRGTALEPIQTGGGQEAHRRAGTENVAGAVGLAAALELAVERRDDTCRRLERFRDRLIDGLTAVPDVRRTGHPTERLPGHASFCVGGARADVLLLGLDMRGICASSGSACSSGSLEPSHVLTALGISGDYAVGALRFSMGHTTRESDVDRVLEVLPPLIERVRAAATALA